MFQVQDANVTSPDINISFALDTTLISPTVKASSQWKYEKDPSNVQKYTKYTFIIPLRFSQTTCYKSVIVRFLACTYIQFSMNRGTTWRRLTTPIEPIGARVAEELATRANYA